jgi:flagellar biosynthesis/type III secretory pathway ATPase
MRELMASYKRSEILVKIGEYKKGADATIDEALDKWPRILEFLKQGTNEFMTFEETQQKLQELVG